MDKPTIRSTPISQDTTWPWDTPANVSLHRCEVTAGFCNRAGAIRTTHAANVPSVTFHSSEYLPRALGCLRCKICHSNQMSSTQKDRHTRNSEARVINLWFALFTTNNPWPLHPSPSCAFYLLSFWWIRDSLCEWFAAFGICNSQTCALSRTISHTRLYVSIVPGPVDVYMCCPGYRRSRTQILLNATEKEWEG